MNRRRILPSITSHSKSGSTWQDKIAELSILKLNTVGLFLTGLSNYERRECFKLLLRVKRAQQLKIPFIHAVSTMPETEYRAWISEFHTEWFNLHPLDEFPLKYRLSKTIRSKILIENANYKRGLNEDLLEAFAGLCIDLSHLEDARRSEPMAFATTFLTTINHPVYANHLSAVSNLKNSDNAYSNHHAKSAEEFKYLENLPTSSISSLIALELENPLQEQCTFIPVIEEILGNSHDQKIDEAA